MTDGRTIHLARVLHAARIQPEHITITAPDPIRANDSSSSPSRETSPTMSPGRDRDAPRQQTSQLLQLPNDIFKCVMDYLDRDAAWSLKRTCHGMANAKAVDELLLKYPIQWPDIKELKLHDWRYRSNGLLRWEHFKKCVTDANRNKIQKLAMSHWHSIADFKWIEENLPALHSLDISAIKDFVWTPEETWTWKELATTCPKLFERLDELEVANWADYTAHSRIEYSYSYNDYKFKQRFRISRRRDGGSVARMIFPQCKNLKTLAIRERYSGFHTWNEWEVHQRVCCLVDGVTKNCPPSLTKLRAYDYAPYRSLFSTNATNWSNITDVEIDLYSWMEDRRDRDFIGPVPYRIAQGSHHREEEGTKFKPSLATLTDTYLDAFDDKTYEECSRDHLHLGSHVVQGAGASFEDLLQSLRTVITQYPRIRLKPINKPNTVVLQPFHLINVHQRRMHVNGNLQGGVVQHPDPVTNPEIQEALKWLATNWKFKPVLAWDNMMCDVFPANLEPSRTFLTKIDVLSRIHRMVFTLRSLGIPIRISIGDRSNSFPSSGLDGSLYFGDFKTFEGEGNQRRELLLPTQAAFNLSGIASMIDELIIQYPADVPGVHGWLRSTKRPTPAEAILFQREMVGWRRFWHRYARQLVNLKKLTAHIPNDIYDDWGKCQGLRELLSDERWQMLEVEERASDFGVFGSCFSLANLCYNFSRKHPRIKFVQRVFFRDDNDVLKLNGPDPRLSEQELEEAQISDANIAFDEAQPHRFWPEKPPKPAKKGKGTKGKGEKRKAGGGKEENGDEDGNQEDDEETGVSKKRKID